MSVPVYRIVLEGVDGGEDSEVLAGMGAYGARTVFAHFVNEPSCRLRVSGERIAWATLFRLEADGWLLVDVAQAAAGDEVPAPVEPSPSDDLEATAAANTYARDVAAAQSFEGLAAAERRLLAAPLEPGAPRCSCGDRPAGLCPCDNYGAW